jgi:molecular chaperone DnaK
LLGEFVIDNLEPEEPGELAKITIQFDLTLDGILKVTARDRQTGKEEKIEVAAAKARLSETEILSAQHRLSEAVFGERAAPLSDENLALLTKAEGLLATGNLDPDQSEELTDLIDAIRASASADEQQELVDELLDLLFDLEN